VKGNDMSAAAMKADHPPADPSAVSFREAGRTELLPRYYETELVVTPSDNAPHSPAMLASLEASMREHGQLVPGWVAPSPDLPETQRLCLEGNGRLAVARRMGRPFWAFDLGRDVPEAERIRLMFQHHQCRRAWSREEIAERAARYIELTNCPAAEAARLLGVSGPTLSRAFGERRILPELRERADRLGLSMRSLIAAVPPACMARALDFAETTDASGKKPTRDQVAAFIQQLKKRKSQAKSRKAKSVALRMGGRVVTLTVGDGDSAASVAEDLKAIVARLGKHADVPPDGWHFLFQ
jgi:hypothetical protein